MTIKPEIIFGVPLGIHHQRSYEENVKRLEKINERDRKRESKRRKGWRNKYKGQDMEALTELAKSYFVPSKGGKNKLYVGPEGEYQKWYALIHRKKKAILKEEWRQKNLIKDKIRSSKKGIEFNFKTKVAVLLKVSGASQPECCICHTNDIRVLTVNHIYGNARKEKSDFDKFGKFYLAILNNLRAINDLEVRCYNCNILYEYERGVRNLPPNWKEILKEYNDPTSSDSKF